MNNLLGGILVPPIPSFKQLTKKISPKVPQKFDMTQAVPAFATFSVIREKLAEDLRGDQASFYTDIFGRPDLREAIAQEHPLSKHITSDCVAVTAGANQAMFAAMILYFQAGDRVALPEPYYFNYDMGLKMLGIEPLYVPLLAKNNFKLNADDLIEQVKKQSCRGIILVSPNNPTGACYASSEIVKLLQWTAASGIEVILDETYRRFDGQHLNDVEIQSYIGHGLTLVGSFSKIYSLTGYRVGYMIAGQRQMQEYLKIQDTMIICAPHISQLAALYGIRYCQNDLREKITVFERLTIQLCEQTKALKCFKLHSAGAFFAYLEHPFVSMSSTEAALELYRQTGILSLPGSVFGPSQEKYLRLAYGNLDQERLQQALQALVAFDDKVASAEKENYGKAS